MSAELDRETVLDAPGALEYGLVDRIVPGRGAAGRAPEAR